jgi:hypothetical protein
MGAAFGIAIRLEALMAQLSDREIATTPNLKSPTVQRLDYAHHQLISLKSHPSFNEVWVHERIRENPSLLGLGDLDVRDFERRQPGAGRLRLASSGAHVESPI